MPGDRCVTSSTLLPIATGGRPEAQERAKDRVASHQRVHLDAFVVTMSVLRVTGAEVDGVDAGQGELRDRCPRLLGP